jgi:hypothetical protein
MLRRVSGPNKEGQECYAYVLCETKCVQQLVQHGVTQVAPDKIGIVILKGMGKPTEETDREARVILKQQYMKAA